MESQNRTVWIVLAVVLIVLCCCVALTGLAAAGLVTSQASNLGPFELPGSCEERTEWGFEVGDEPALEITNFAGRITIQPGERDTIHVVATKKASTRSNLERIRISASAPDDGGRVVIKTQRPPSTGNASVEMVITVPAGTQLDVDTGAGTVDVGGITGPVAIHSGAGTVNLHGAAGSAQVRLGAGTINYEGSPAGYCSFESGAGTINLTLPADLNMEVDVSTGAGKVDVAHDVDGRVTKQSARGTVGDGSQGTVYAHIGAGDISLTR